ncbi:ABC transporter permease [Kordiimonas marina]|uniref:ABC transporter permease n=1 Tax=Kordiimonas marina TaxID=2872312 RepID=UPI001FF2CF43|nr:FtsX-like permease family protein [Kordiimonas marina]MCJ9427711.1 FtsX-like permease family protein [Kordiimonas marina]
MTDFYIVWKNLTRKPLRLFLTLFATFIAFTIYGTITAFQVAWDSGVNLAADDRLVTVNKINFTQPLPVSYVNKVRAVKGVAAVTQMNWFGGYFQDPRKQLVMMAVDAPSFLEVYDQVVLTPKEQEAWIQDRQGLIAGEAVARTYGWKVGDHIPVNSNIFSQKDGRTAWDFTIDGIFKGKTPQTDTNSVYFHYKYFNETKSFGKDYIGFLGIRTTDPKLNEQVIKTVDDMFANTPFETQTVPEKVFNKGFIEQIGNIRLILTSVVGAAFFIILVIVGNSMVLAIRERTGEIAVMKTLGFQSGRLFRMILSESMMLALLGGGLGLSAATGLTWLITSKMPQMPPLLMTHSIVLQSLGFMLAMGLLTGIIPAVNALRLNIITAFSRQ